MNVVSSFESVRKLAHRRVALVPTMGYLHEGHISLIEAAARQADTVVVSIFVNPLQFGNRSDLETYPADLGRDTGIAQSAGADVVFAPSRAQMYPEEPLTVVTVPTVGDAMEGERRPGHFDGVATVVAKLLSGVRPDVALFGRKDAQQLAVVSTMVRDLSMPVEVIGVPTVREADGLALSTRNTRLDPQSRVAANTLSRALFDAADRFSRGEREAALLMVPARSMLEAEQGIDIDYLELADAATARPVLRVEDESFIAVAATIGGVRLIDNVFLDGRTGAFDTGSAIAGTSILYGGG